MAGFTPKTFLKHDDYMTPKSAWVNVAHLLPKDKVIWEAFYGDGKSAEYLRELGFQVIHEEIDFFAEDRGDVIVSNPPFSKKKEVLQRLKELDKPFLLIMPCSALTTQYMREMFTDSLQIIVPRRRIHFDKQVNGVSVFERSSCNFDCFYYCYKWNLPRDLLFLE